MTALTQCAHITYIDLFHLPRRAKVMLPMQAYAAARPGPCGEVPPKPTLGREIGAHHVREVQQIRPLVARRVEDQDIGAAEARLPHPIQALLERGGGDHARLYP